LQSLNLCAESIGGIQWWASQSRNVALAASGDASVAASGVGALHDVGAKWSIAAAAAADTVTYMDVYGLVWTLYAWTFKLCMELYDLWLLWLRIVIYGMPVMCIVINMSCLWCLLCYICVLGPYTRKNSHNMVTLPCAFTIAHGKVCSHIPVCRVLLP